MRTNHLAKQTLTGMLSDDAPKHWIDGSGERWRTLSVKGRIKYRHPGALALRAFVFARDGHRCVLCGARQVRDVAPMCDNGAWCLVLDHIISRRNGGSHHPGNLQTLCDRCNSQKASLVDARAVAG